MTAQQERIVTVRKDRTVDGERVRGRVHQWTDDHQTLCGRRVPGVVTQRPDQHPDTLTCPECIRHRAHGTHGSYRRR